MRLDWFLYHVASGHAFFSGLALIAAAVGIGAITADTSRWRRVMPIATLLGVLLVAVSATPLPWVMYAVFAVALATWIVVGARRTRLSNRAVASARILLGLFLIAAAALELPWHIRPEVPTGSATALAVIADSVTAGIGENEAVTWPARLSDRHGITVHDHSAMGATVASAREQAELLTPEDDVVLIEIGGNDLLGSTSAEDFASGLEALLRDVSKPGRTLVMFELPLPPTFNRYGMIQRRLATKYDVVLIPKRTLMGVLTGRAATLDSIHLSQPGHDRMAEVVWKIVSPAFQPDSE